MPPTVSGSKLENLPGTLVSPIEPSPVTWTLRESGVPLTVRQGRGGGISLIHSGRAISIVFDLAEVAALMSSLAALGPSVSQSAASAMRKLTEALDPAD